MPALGPNPEVTASQQQGLVHLNHRTLCWTNLPALPTRQSLALPSLLTFTRRRRRRFRRKGWPPPTVGTPGQLTTCRRAPQECHAPPSPLQWPVVTHNRPPVASAVNHKPSVDFCGYWQRQNSIATPYWRCDRQWRRRQMVGQTPSWRAMPRQLRAARRLQTVC